MPSKTFNARLAETPPFMRWLNRVVVAFLCVHLTLATYSGYRAIYQLRRVDIHAPSDGVHVGTSISVDIVTSGRTEADAQLDLVQGKLVEKLGQAYLPRNGNASWDPRAQRATISVVLSSENVAKFQTGPAVLRATAYGSSQWLRTPPPMVRELFVEIR